MHGHPPIWHHMSLHLKIGIPESYWLVFIIPVKFYFIGVYPTFRNTHVSMIANLTQKRLLTHKCTHTYIYKYIYSQFNVRVDLDMCSCFFIFCKHWISSSFCLLELCNKLHRILLGNARVETNGYGALRLPKCWFNPMIFGIESPM